MSWVQRKASEVVAGDILIRNVQPGLEWAAVECGAFIIQDVKSVGDEQRLRGIDATGMDKKRRSFAYDTSELVWIKPNLH